MSLCESCDFAVVEPGYYETNKFGIRLENIVRVVPANTTVRIKLSETLTPISIPVDNTLIEILNCTSHSLNRIQIKQCWSIRIYKSNK